MRRLLCCVFALLMVFLLCLPSAASEIEIGADIDPGEGLPEEVLDALGDFDATQTRDFGTELAALLLRALRMLSGTVSAGLCSGGIMLAAVLLCGLLSSWDKGERATQLVGTLAIVGAGAGSLRSMILLASQTLSSLREYSLLLLPGLAGLTTLSGGTTTGAAVYTGGVLFFDILMQISTALVLPLTWLYTACCAADTAIGDGLLTSFSEFIKWIATKLLKWTSYLFTGYLSVTGIFGGSVDAARLKTAKVALSGVVPVVGSIISDASDSLLSAAAMLKNAVGIYGMLAVLALCLLPFLQLGVQYLILKGTAALSGLFGQKQLTSLIDRLADSLGLLLGMTGAYCTAALVCIVLCVKAVGM